MKWLLVNFVRRAQTQFKLSIVNGIIRFFPGFVKAIVSRDQAGVDQISVVQHALSYSRDPVITINFFSTQPGYSCATIWAAIINSSSDITGVWSSLYRSRDLIQCKELRLRVEIKGQLNRPSGDNIDFPSLLNEYAIVSIHSDKPRTLANSLATLIVAKGPVEDVDGMLDQIGLDPFSLTEFQQIRFLSRLERSGEIEKFKYWESRLASSMSRAGRLKVSLLRSGLFENGVSSFEELQRGFSSLTFRVSEIFKEEISPLYSDIPASKDYLAARFDTKQKSQLRDTLIGAVEAGESLSYLRLGDGECYGFADQVSVDERGEARQEQHWWGEELELSLRHELQVRFRDSVNQATIVGVPTVLRLIKDFNLTNREDYPVNSLISRIICVMRGAAPYLEGKVIVEDQSNLFLFNQEFIDQIFSVAKKVCVVSGVRTALVRRWAPDESKLHCIEVPTHRLLREEAVGSTTDGVLPRVYEHFLKSISLHSGPGVVVLVSAGFIGKIFVAEAAKNGAVALDMGQTLVAAVGDAGVRE